MLDKLRGDISFTARSLRRAPTFTLTVALVLGLAIAMSSAMFTVFRAILLDRLPVAQQDRIVELSGVAGGAASEVPIFPGQLKRFRAQSRTLTAVSGFAHWRVIVEALTDGDRRLSLREAVVTDDFFAVLGASPALGRLFRRGDMVPWGANAAGAAVPIVLSHSAWQRAFGGDASVVGRHLFVPKMNWSLTVIGVAPPGLDYPRGVEYWVASEYGSLDVVARLAANATPAAARNELLAFLANDPDEARYIGANVLGAQVHTLSDMVTGDARAALFALTAAVTLVLVLACANVANLLLLRAAARSREMTIRRAIGASSADLLRQLLTESALLALVAGTLGAVVSRMLLDGLLWLAPTGLPRVDVIALAGTPMLAVASVAVVTILLFGLLPSLASVHSVRSVLRSDTRSGTESRRLRRLRQALVVSQVALAVVVLAGAGLLLRSLERLASIDMGYATDHLSMVNFSLPWRQYQDDCRPKGNALSAADTAVWSRCAASTNFAAHERVMAKLREVPGIASVSPEAVPPFLGSNVWMGRLAAEEQSDAQSKANPWFAADAVGPDYFMTMGVALIAGRVFTNADREDSPRVAVITEQVARTLWPNQSAVGKRLRVGEDHTPDSLITVVGVVRDFHYRQHRESTPTVFRPYRQIIAQGYLVVRTHSAVTPDALRRAIEAAGGGATFVRAQSMDDLIAPQLATPRFEALLLTLFALAALVLAAVGLYGVIASTVAQQEREIGIRMALGATSARVRRMVLRQALVVAVVGAVVGLVGALIGSRMLASMLFGITPTDPATLAGVAVLLLVVASVAAYIPARRATTIDPANALRAE